MAPRRRGTTTAGPGAGLDLTVELRAALPPRFESVGEALASGPDSVVACEVLGGVLARDGVSLPEALDDLARTWRLVRGEAPAYAETRALSIAWGESTLRYLHAVSCDDPRTGLASLAHVRTAIDDLRRGGRGRETIGRLAPGRLAVLAERDELLLRRFDLLLRMIDAGDPPRPRAWIESLPETEAGVEALLDELTRA